MNEKKVVLLEIIPNKDFTLTLKYDDGMEGILEINKIFEGDKYPELKEWEYFQTVLIDSKSNDIVWDNGAELCKDASYRILSLKSFMGRMGFDKEMFE